MQDLADDASAIGDDEVDITSADPSSRATDNIITLLGSYNINDATAQRLYGGSITQGAGGTEVVYSGLQVLGSVNNLATELQIVQNNTLLTPFWGDQSAGGYNGNAAAGVLMRVLVKSRAAGADIDGKRIRVQARHWGDSYEFFNVTLGQGESVAAISTIADPQNTTLQATVQGYTQITNIPGYQTIDLNNGNGLREYYSQWTFGDGSNGGLKAVWEWAKDLTGTGTAKSIHGLNGELFLGVTHSVAYNNESGGPFSEDEILSWGTGATAGTGALLALDDEGLTGTLHIQLLTGVAPTSGLTVTGGTSLATADVNGAPAARTVPKVFIGSYTGSLIGAFGIGVKPADLTASDSLQDLTGTAQTPPNNVQVKVSGLVASEDYVVVARNDGGGNIDTSQYTLAAGNNSGNGTVVVNEAIFPDDPPAGVIRLQRPGSTVFDRYPYISRSGSTFTLSGTLSTNYTLNDSAFVPVIDELAGATDAVNTLVFAAPFAVVGRVRDGGVTPIKPFPITGTVGAAGFSVTAIRTPDE